jgi:CBS domain containing-hemolysin-like protein/mannitol/fructose-specific phosphotransferase system IIA component (Ntr-type)
MDWMTPLYILASVVLVLLNGFFVLAEFALVKVRATRIEELTRQGNRRAAVAREMVGHLDNYLTATQLGITVASLGLGWVGEPAFAGIVESVIGLPGWWSSGINHTLSVIISFSIITFLHILIGELAPKSMAIRSPEWSALLVAQPMRWAYSMFYLPMTVLNGASNWILKWIGLEAGHSEVAHTEQELRMLLSTAETTRSFSFSRLLMLENIFDLGHQRVRDAMIPWSRVLHLDRTATRDEVIRKLTEHRFSRWPVMDPLTNSPMGYLLMKDLIVLSENDRDWIRIIRPLRTVRPDDNLEAVMQDLQRDGANMAVVLDGGRPIGLITLEDVLEEVVGRIEDEYPRLPRLFLKDALATGGVVLDVAATTPEEAIRALTNAIPKGAIPPGVDAHAIAMARERQMSSDVGHGVAIPHARCPQLPRPVIVFGRSEEGIAFSDATPEPVKLIFLLVTPLERPNVQVFLLAQIASVARSELVRDRLQRAETAEEVIEIIAAADPAVTG